MNNTKRDSLKFRFHQWLDRFIFRQGRKIQESNVSVVKYFFYIFTFQTLFYLFFYWQGHYHPISWGVPIWTPEVALPTILTITGVIFTIIVLLAIKPKRTQFGNEFIDILIEEINVLKKDQEITVIAPNINIGTTTYPFYLKNLIEVLQKAKERGVKVVFKSYSLKEDYLNTFILNANNLIGDYINFYTEGKNNESDMLNYLYGLYDKHGVHKDEYANTIKILKSLIKCVTIVKPSTNILEQRIVGFLSDNKFYLGKFLPDSSNDKQIVVKGEIIDTPETVEMLKTHFIKDL